MAANILKSRMAVSMSIYVVRAFVRMREELTSRRDLEERLDQIEKILLVHDTQLKELFEKIRPLLLQPHEKPRKKIGFEIKEKLVGYGKRDDTGGSGTERYARSARTSSHPHPFA